MEELNVSDGLILADDEQETISVGTTMVHVTPVYRRPPEEAAGLIVATAR